MHCVECAEHAHHDLTSGECVCDECWSGVGCSVLDHNCCSCTCGKYWDDSGNDAFWHRECYATGNEGCDYCTANAYRNSYGECQCHEDWVTDCCDHYRGECSCHCEACSGPNHDQCLSCAGHGTLLNGVCTCDNGWTGCRCDQYAGVCHKLCIGCFGPTEWDCIECAPNSAMSPQNGMCECLSGWTGDCCLTKIHTCHPSCATCTTDSEGGAHECESCYNGFYLSDQPSGYCYPCDANCKYCETTATTCTDCYDGNFLLDAHCDACHPCCGACTGPSAFECETCNAGSAIVAETTYCGCENGGFLDLCTCGCRAHCATGIVADEFGMCPLSTPGLAMNFNFELHAELTNLVDASICANWCHPHMPVVGGNRGGYFDGTKSSLLLNNFIMNG